MDGGSRSPSTSSRPVLILILLFLLASSWLAGTTIRTYLRSMQAFRALRVEIPSGGQAVAARVDLTIAVLNGAPTSLAVDQLELGFYLRDRLVARHTVISTREVIAPLTARRYPISLTLSASQQELVGTMGRNLGWSAQGVALVRTNGMRRSVPLRVATPP